MQEYPHHYTVAASSQADGIVSLDSSMLESINSAPPAEFGGPGDLWSPETLLVAAVADCFVLSFKAIARASSLSWESLRCDVEGVLNRVDKVTQFTEFTLHASLEISPEMNTEKAVRLLEKAENACLITNSLKSETHLKTSVTVSTNSKTT